MSTAFARSVALGSVRFYQLAISPWLAPACRFTPTCSDYAVQAIEQYGGVRGTLKALSRLFRCHPLHRGGFDPLV